MNLELEIPSELEQKLKLRASVAGKDVTTFVIDTLKEELSQNENSTNPRLFNSSFSSWLSNW